MRIALARIGIALALGAVAAGCAVAPRAQDAAAAWPANLPDRVELDRVPFFPQDAFQCGPAALAIVMAHQGARVTPESLAPYLYVPARKGTLQVEMLAAPRRHGLASHVLAPRIEEVLQEVAAGTPVIVLQHYRDWIRDDWHYAVVIGFDRTRGEVLLHSGTAARQAMGLEAFVRSWSQGGRWAMVVARPGHIPVTASEADWREAIRAMARVHRPGG
jgi:hypothetical protein